MENNTNLSTDTGVDVNAATVESVEVNTASNEMISLSKSDYEKALQSAEDKVRSKAAKDIKVLQAKITELTPAEKSQSDIELETRLAALEAREKATAAKEQIINIQSALSAKGLNKRNWLII